MGPVIDRLSDLWPKLSLTNPYADVQKQLFHDTFSVTQESSGARAAHAIHHYLTEINHE